MQRFKIFTICLVGIWMASTPLKAQDLTPDNLVARAQKEGKVVWYTTPGTQNWLRAALDEWKRTYPAIAVEIVEATGAESTERVRTERRAARPVADMISLGDVQSFQFAADKAVQPIDVKLLPNFTALSPTLKPILDPENRLIPTWGQAYGMVVNTSLVAEADMPRKWTDLLSPKFAGRISLQDVTRVGGGLVFFMIGEPVLGEKFFADLIAQKPRLVSRGQENFAAVARGERWIGVPAGSGDLAAHRSAPVKIIYPEDGAFFIIQNSGIVVDAPHPAAAHLFLNFLLSPQVQSQYVAGGLLSVRDDVKSDDVSLAKQKFLGIGFQTPEATPKTQQYLDAAAKLLR